MARASKDASGRSLLAAIGDIQTDETQVALIDSELANESAAHPS